MTNSDGFEDVLAHLQTLPDTKAKIAYLIDVKTAYLQSYPETDPNPSEFLSGAPDPWSMSPSSSSSSSARPFVRGFDEKCDLEIEKLRQLLELQKEEIRVDASDSSSKGVDEPETDKTKANTSIQRLTTKQVVLLFKDLAPRLASLDKKRAAEIISSIVNYKSETIRQDLSNITNPSYEQSPEGKNDREKVENRKRDLLGDNL